MLINVALGNKEKSWPQVLTILSASQLCLVCGILNAWPSPFSPKIVRDKKNYNITEDQAAYFTVIGAVAIFVLSPFLVPVNKRFGRKYLLLAVTVPYSISLILKAFCTNLWVLYVARFLAGFGDAMLMPAFSSYTGEIATPRIRGVWGTSFSSATFFGAFLVNVFGSNLNIQQTSYISLGIIVLFIITFAYMPESPYFLIAHNKDIEAKESIKFLRGTYNVDEEFLQIKTAVCRQISESGSWKDLVTLKSNRRALLVGVFIRTGQQFSGLFLFSFYTQYIFEKAKINIAPSTAAQLYSATTFLSYVCFSAFSDWLGRRKSYLLSLFFSSIVCLGLSIYFFINNNFPEVNMEGIKWLPILGMILFVVVSSFGIGVATFLMMSELFSSGIKAHAMSILNMNYALCTFTVNNLFFLINSYTGLYGPLLFFSLCDLLSMAIAYFIVPDTSGKTLEEIQIIFKNM